MMRGGLGLFLEPGGRPRGRRREISIVAPSLAAAVGGSLVVWVSVCSSCSWEVWKWWRLR